MYFCLVSPLVTKEQLTLDGLVARLEPRSCELRSYRMCCTLYLVFKEPRTTGFHARFSPADASSILLDFAPALFGGTLRIYDDLPSLVNPFFAFWRKNLRRLTWQRNALRPRTLRESCLLNVGDQRIDVNRQH